MTDVQSQGVALDRLLSGLTEAQVPPLAVDGVTEDSRQAGPGVLFLAYPGTFSDGRHYIRDAVERGARVVLYEPEDFQYDQVEVPGVAVGDLRKKASEIASRYFTAPSGELCVIGITGTNGKTSCVHFVAQVLRGLGVRCAVIGTLGYGSIEQLQYDTGLTTPGAVELQKIMRSFVDDGFTHLCMEVSSHALDQARVDAVRFDVAVFTNLSRDHLDYHGCFDDYAQSKRALFRFPDLGLAVLNIDDEVGRAIDEEISAFPVVRYGSSGEVRAETVAVDTRGIRFTLCHSGHRAEVEVDLIGRFNVVNMVAAASVLVGLGHGVEEIAEGLCDLKPVPGRMELFRKSTDGPFAVVDYSHTPDALKLALSSIREHCRGAMWCVFGCGGDRDRGKRPQMGAIAEDLADHVILTNDNPRSERPEDIVTDIRAGMKRDPLVYLDREQAIRAALDHAAPGDWVLVAGKGHETTQTIGSAVLAFNDRATIEQVWGIAA